MEDETTISDEVVVIGYGTMKKRESDFSDFMGQRLKLLILDAKCFTRKSVRRNSFKYRSGGSQPAGKHSNQRSVFEVCTGPLYVVDGIPERYDQYNPADIASIDVLKVEQICYMAQGGKKVIIRTLKGSKDGNVHTNYSSSLH